MAAYDDVAAAYSRTRSPHGARLEDLVLMELLGNVSGQTVLSVACGQGHDARLLARLGATVTGIDISPEMLAIAREEEAAEPLGIAYLDGDAETLALLDGGAFAGVLCHMALMDVPRLDAAIRSVVRVLVPRGWFVFSIVHPCYPPHVANVDDYLRDHRYEKGTPVDWLPTHAYHRPLQTYIDLLVAGGFRLERIVEVHRTAEADPHSVPGLLYARAVLG